MFPITHREDFIQVKSSEGLELAHPRIFGCSQLSKEYENICISCWSIFLLLFQEDSSADIPPGKCDELLAQISRLERDLKHTRARAEKAEDDARRVRVQLNVEKAEVTAIRSELDIIASSVKRDRRSRLDWLVTLLVRFDQPNQHDEVKAMIEEEILRLKGPEERHEPQKDEPEACLVADKGEKSAEEAKEESVPDDGQSKIEVKVPGSAARGRGGMRKRGKVRFRFKF